jgi:hypothetical protein
VTPEPAGLVASGYDAFGSEYLRWAAQIEGDPRLEWLADARTNRRLLEDAGLAVLREDVVTMREPEDDARFHWVLASRPHRGHQ